MTRKDTRDNHPAEPKSDDADRKVVADHDKQSSEHKEKKRMPLGPPAPHDPSRGSIERSP